MFSEQLQQLSIQIIAPLIKPILALFQVQVELLRGDAVKLMQPTLGITPEALDAINVCRAAHELISPVVDPQVLRVTNIYKAVVTAPPVRVDDRFEGYATANNSLQSNLLSVGHDLRIDLALALEEAEDDGLARCATTARSLRTRRAPK